MRLISQTRPLARRALLGGLLASSALALLPPVAPAANVSCAGHIARDKRPNAEPNALRYTVACSVPIKGYTITSTREVDVFSTEVEVFNPIDNSLLQGEAFTCEGDIPGFGINCFGTYKGAYHNIVGYYEVAGDDVCGKERPKAQLVVAVNEKGAMAGPFDLRRPRGCPKPKKTKAKKKATRRANERSDRRS